MFNSFKFKAFIKLQKRITSLEECLGLKFAGEGYPEHFKGDYGELTDLIKQVEFLKKEVAELKNVNKTNEHKE